MAPVRLCHGQLTLYKADPALPAGASPAAGDIQINPPRPQRLQNTLSCLHMASDPSSLLSVPVHCLHLKNRGTALSHPTGSVGTSAAVMFPEKLIPVSCKEKDLAGAFYRPVHKTFRDLHAPLSGAGDLESFPLDHHGSVLGRLQPPSDPQALLPAQPQDRLPKLPVHLKETVIRNGICQHGLHTVALSEKLPGPAAERFPHCGDDVQGLLAFFCLFLIKDAFRVPHPQKRLRLQPLKGFREHLFQLFCQFPAKSAFVPVQQTADLLS